MKSRTIVVVRSQFRGVCFYCRQCSPSCTVYADFSSSSVLVNPALESGSVDLYVKAMVREVNR